MATLSRKQRRRLHAIPAAFALIVVAVLWLLSHRAEAEVLLDASSLSDWQTDCRHCDIEAQYDVLKGEIVRLETRMGRALLSSSSFSSLTTDAPASDAEDVVTPATTIPEGRVPLLSWGWSLDDLNEGADSALMRVSVALQDVDSEREYRVHYVWNPALNRDVRQSLSDTEYVWVVSTPDQQARRWYQVERDLTMDLEVLSGQRLAVNLLAITAGIGEPDGRKVQAGGYFEQIALNYLIEPGRPVTPGTEPIATSV